MNQASCLSFFPCMPRPSATLLFTPHFLVTVFPCFCLCYSPAIPIGEYLACALLVWFGLSSIKSALAQPSHTHSHAAADGTAVASANAGEGEGEEEGSELAEAREYVEKAEVGALGDEVLQSSGGRDGDRGCVAACNLQGVSTHKASCARLSYHQTELLDKWRGGRVGQSTCFAPLFRSTSIRTV